MNLRISSWAIRNPIPVIVAFTLATLAGMIAYTQLPIKQFPNVAFPTVQITVVQDGAAPAEMENQVTRLVENAVATLPNIELTQSSVSLGVSSTVVQFFIGTDLEKAKNDVKSKIDQIRVDLPAGIEAPVVESLDVTGGAPMTTFAVSAPEMSPDDLSWYIDDTITRKLQGIRGVGRVGRIGGIDREINVTLDPTRLAQLGVTAAQVNDRLRAYYRNYGAGRDDSSGTEATVRVIGETETVDELANLTIPLASGSYARLSDVAEVGAGSGEERGFVRYNGRPVSGFNVYRVDDASEVHVEDAIFEAITQLEAENPKIKITKIFSMVDEVRANFEATMHVLIEGMVLAALVVLLFLRDWRATLIAAAAMPLSLIPTFFVVNMLGFSLNVVTLLAFTLVIGILVDDAIVEIENIQKRTQRGHTPFRAAMEGADAIGLAVVATTAAIVVVFLPVSFMKGIVGQFFISFGLSVAVAVVFSLAVARFVTPLMAAYLLKPAKHVHEAASLPGWYEGPLKWSMGNPLKASGLGLLSFVAAVMAMSQLGFGFIPTDNVPYVSFSLQGPPGTTRVQMEEASRRLDKLLHEQPDVEDVFISVGSTGSNGDVGSGTAYALLKHERSMSSDDFRQSIRPKLADIPDIRITASQGGGGPQAADVQVILLGQDEAELQKQGLALLKEMQQLPQIAQPRLAPAPPGPELVIRPRREEAARLNVSTEAIASVVRIATTGDIEANTPKFSEGERRLPIRIRLPESIRADQSELAELRVPTRDGGMTTLGAVADIGYELGASKLARFYREGSVTVEADFAKGYASGDATDAVNNTNTIKNLPPTVRRASIGNEQAQAEMGTGIVMAMLTGVALIYSVLVLLFRSVFKPIVILSALPLSFSGAFVALLIVNMDISMPVFIGLLMLLGLAAKNSILLVEFAIEAERRGSSVRDSLMEACRERARPIVMTTVAMVAGMLPTAIGLGDGASFRQPMAVAVIGGLVSSTILSLLLVPVVYVIISWLERAINPLAGKLVTPRTPEDDALMHAHGGGKPDATHAE